MPGLPQYRSNLATSQYGAGEAEAPLGRRVNACADWRAASTLFGDLDREGKLRPAEQHDIEELRTRLTSCPCSVTALFESARSRAHHARA
jgi:hypothetical protein